MEENKTTTELAVMTEEINLSDLVEFLIRAESKFPNDQDLGNEIRKIINNLKR